MFLAKNEKAGTKKPARKDIAAEVTNIFEELITAFIMALVIVTFVIRPFIIPTGSMADTLKGAHFRLRCPQCGYRYELNFEPGEYGLPRNVVPRGKIKVPHSRCPSCGYYQVGGQGLLVTKGDKILALKCLYQFFEPRRWDVVVFRYPIDPTEKFIKRLIGRPGETVEIIDGDVYIDGQISRKPPKVQKELWMPVYNNDYQPARPRAGLFNGHIWQQPFKNVAESRWMVSETDPTKFSLDSPAEQVNTLIYDTTIGNDFRATYAYNDVRRYDYMPYCSDLMVRFHADSTRQLGHVGISLSKYQNNYRAWVDVTGQMFIARMDNGEEIILNTKSIEPFTVNQPVLVKFANVDYRLIFEFGDEKLTYDLGRLADDLGQRRTDVKPEVKIFGSGKLTLSHIAVFRDVHYTGKFAGSSQSGRAAEGSPLVLGKDEFFVLGDNSPVSGDGRWWSEHGRGNSGQTYRLGIVPREYLVAKALFVFWPSGFRPFAEFPFSFIPDIGRMRLIHGGSGR